MTGLVDWAVSQWRLVISTLVLCILVGYSAYVGIPKEADPDIQIPFISISVPYPGISPEDAERLLVKPMEVELRSIEGLKQLTAIAAQNYAGLYLEFDVSFDKDAALQRVREKIDLAQSKMPEGAEEPVITEFNVSTFPVLVVTLSGEVPERTLLSLARQLEDEIETIPSVLSSDVIGNREELLEIVIDPARLDAYNISAIEVFNAVNGNNQIIAAGDWDIGSGRFPIKVEGLIETRQDVLDLPIRSSGDGVVRLRDVADIRSTFVDADSFARFNGQTTIALEVKKRTGENIVATIARVREVVNAFTANLPPQVKVDFSLDQSTWIDGSLKSLESSILLAILLVMIVVVAALGLRSGMIVGFAIPTSFLIAFLFLGIAGMTINMMVMFGMILAVGMLVDGAIIIVEFADRKMAEGMHRREAYALAAKRMFYPVLSSTATTLAAFLPMLFWPGVSGQFMSYLPITLILVLAASTLVALVFLPVVGGFVGKAQSGNEETLKALAASETGDIREIGGITGWYAQLVGKLVQRPFTVLFTAIGTLVAVVIAFGAFSKGTEFFVETEPNRAFINVFARGNLSAAEQLALVKEVEAIALTTEGLRGVFTQTGGGGGMGQGGRSGEDMIGTISIEFDDFEKRRRANVILDEIRGRMNAIPGIRAEARAEEGGPPQGKDIIVELTSNDGAALDAMTALLRTKFESMPELIDIEDSRPLPGIEYRLEIDREQAGRFGADVLTIGTVVQLITVGIKVGEYRPDTSEDEVEIRVRFPAEDRSIDMLDSLRVMTRDGLVPISNFVKRVPAPRVSFIERVDGERIMRVRANVMTGVLPDDKVREIKAWLAETQIDPRVKIGFGGQDEAAAESAAFLGNAMLASLFLMGAILIMQFNSFYHTILILSAVIMSTIGVMLGMLVMGQTFSVIMTGTGIVALAGIVVNNNIVLIDTFQHLRREGFPVYDAIIRTGAQRLRPVFLTTFTTMIGLMPMMLNLNIDFFERHVSVGGPISDWWVQLATAVVYGMGFSTVLTLLVTPALLAIPEKLKERRLKNAAPKGPRGAPLSAD